MYVHVFFCVMCRDRSESRASGVAPQLKFWVSQARSTVDYGFSKTDSSRHTVAPLILPLIFQSHIHTIFCHLVTIISKYLHSSHFASLVVFKLIRKSQFKSKFASSFSCKIPGISHHSFLSVYYFLALLQVVYMSIIKYFGFIDKLLKAVRHCAEN